MEIETILIFLEGLWKRIVAWRFGSRNVNQGFAIGIITIG